MQNVLFGVHFRAFEEWVDNFIASKDETFWNSQALPERWLKVIDNDGDYFDN
ncbi:hypothetical protein ALC60_09110 [Trachymyrmex zeteki]|uniref:Uncharacterized protein n=1 Tax=Mycetomoellerius zeteki TaxID=64791 RepID=A0A151WV21_9HYME|nr:hypothetical protein ALC60_09110 [Trachymyrmex zeteki]